MTKDKPREWVKITGSNGLSWLDRGAVVLVEREGDMVGIGLLGGHKTAFECSDEQFLSLLIFLEIKTDDEG